MGFTGLSIYPILRNSKQSSVTQSNLFKANEDWWEQDRAPGKWDSRNEVGKQDFGF